MEFTSKYIETSPGVRLHVMTAGPTKGSLLIFLHGFPEYWRSFEKIALKFAQKGFRILLPDMRGYNLSDKPKGVMEYTSQKIAEDIIALIDHEEKEKAIVIGHDWGAQINWTLASNYSERIEKVVVLNVPHPVIFKKTLTTNLKQMKNSWYMFLVQLPWIPEKLFGKSDFKYFANEMKRSIVNPEARESGPGAQHYIDSWKIKNAFHSMLNYYRAIFRTPTYKFKTPIEIPVLIIWGDRDVVLISKMADESLSKCTNAKIVHIPEGGHFVQHDCPEKVSALIENFII